MGTLVDEEITRSIIGAFYEVYNTLGLGFLEHIYVMALERELVARGHHVARQVSNLEVGLLLHFGPTASVYREIRSSPKKKSVESVKSAESD